MKKLPIHFNNEDLKELNELIDMLGISETYGAIPKAIKFSIIYSKTMLKEQSKVIPDMEPSQIQWLFQSWLKIRQLARLKDEASKLTGKYNPEL